MLYLIWILIAIGNLGPKLSGLDFQHGFSLVNSYINQTAGSASLFAIIAIFGGLLLANRLGQQGHGCLSSGVRAVAFLISVIGLFAFWGSFVSSGFVFSFSPNYGIIRWEFLFFAICPVLDSLLIFFGGREIIKSMTYSELGSY